MASSLFDKVLLECKWRNVPFPITSFRTRITQDIAQHKLADRDGARVEATGRNPIEFSATVPCRVGIAKAKTESWSNLYPETWRQLIAAMSDRSSGPLQHPSMGIVQCKPVSCESSLDAGNQGGEDLSLSWIEFSEEEISSNDLFRGISAVAEAVVSATDLDSRLPSTPHAAADPDNGKVTFEDAMRGIQAAVDTASLVGRKYLGAIDRVAYRIDRVAFSVEQARDPQNWQLKQSLARLKSALRRLRDASLVSFRDVRTYIVPGDTTLGNLAAKLDNKVTELIRLNPTLASVPEIPARTAVRYYKAT